MDCLNRLDDKFCIISNLSNELSNEEEMSLFDNYIENLLHSNEKIIITDYLYQIVWNNKIDYYNTVTKHFVNYIKQKKNNN